MSLGGDDFLGEGLWYGGREWRCEPRRTEGAPKMPLWPWRWKVGNVPSAGRSAPDRHRENQTKLRL